MNDNQHEYNRRWLEQAMLCPGCGARSDQTHQHWCPWLKQHQHHSEQIQEHFQEVRFHADDRDIA